MGRPKKEKTPTDMVIEEFTAHFAQKFAGKAVLKTPFHFFDWAAGKTGGSAESCERERTELIDRFDAYCRRAKVKQTWRKAVGWWVEGKVKKEAK